MTTFTFSFWYNVPVETFKNKKRSFEKKAKNNLASFFAVVLPLFAIALWALVFSINNYNQTSNYRENEIAVVMDSFADSLSYWCITNFTAELEKNPANIKFVKKIRVTDNKKNPVFPDFSYKLIQCDTSDYSRIVENYFPETQWNSIPVSSITNNCATFVVNEKILANALTKIPAVQIAIAWQMASDAVRHSQTNRAAEIYQLMQTVFADYVDINGFPVKLTAQLEQLKLRQDENELRKCFTDVISHYDFRDLPDTRNAVISLFNNTPYYERVKDYILPLDEKPFKFSLDTDSKSLLCDAWFQSTFFVDCIRQNWAIESAGKASNALVKIIVRSQDEPAPIGEFLSTNIFGSVLSVVPFDAEKWEKKYKTKMMIQIVLLSMFLIVLIGLTVRAVKFARAESSLTNQQLNFIAAVSHELRTPIATTRVLAETITRGVIENPDEQKEYANLIVSESDNLTRLVDNILDVFNSGKKRRYVFDKISVNKIIDKVVKTYSLSNPEIKFNVSRNSENEIMGDQHAIERVLFNLIDNAIKYSDAKSTIDIITREINGNVEIIVKDYGIGIPENEQKNIFEKFYRVGDELTRERPGAGLGLAIVKEIIEAHNGKINVKSVPGQGSEFIIKIPLIK